MPTPELHPDAVRLLDRMTAPPSGRHGVLSDDVDLAHTDPLILGDVWAVAEAVHRREEYRPKQSVAGETAGTIIRLLEDRVPAFRGSACRDYLDLLTQEIEQEGPKAFASNAIERGRRACVAVCRCVDLSFDGLKASSERLLAVCDWPMMPHLVLALARLVDAECSERTLEMLASKAADSPLLLDELRLAARLDLHASCVLADVACPTFAGANAKLGDRPHRLSDFPLYIQFAREALEQAAERVRRIHTFEQPYASDKAFTRSEAEVISRSTRVALDRDEAWLTPVLDALFKGVCVAPTSAKTMPSQSVAIALGHALEAYPTPEAVVTLRGVLRVIRHAGVERKLQRNLRGAERRLAARSTIAFRLPGDRPLSKPALLTLTRALEGGLSSALALPYGEWRLRLAEHPDTRALAGSLVWRMPDETGEMISVLPTIHHGQLSLRGVDGQALTADTGGSVALWHPLNATSEERSAWRDRLVELRIKQPFKQVFREHYNLTAHEWSQAEIAMFSGHVVSLRPFIGLARREGWLVDDQSHIARAVGRWTVMLDLDTQVHPGAIGWATTRGLSIQASEAPHRSAACFGDLPAVALSEVLRSVDLLVSTSGFAVGSAEDGNEGRTPHRQVHLAQLAERPLGPMAEMRKEAIRRVLGGPDETPRLQFDSRHLRVGRFAIHLATGRVTCGGDPVTLGTAERTTLTAVPWLPYDEKLLELITRTAWRLLEKEKI